MGEDGGVALEQVKACLAGFLRNAGGDDNNAGPGQIRVATSADSQRMCEGNGVKDVIRLRFGTGLVQIHEDDFAPNAAHNERECRR